MDGFGLPPFQFNSKWQIENYAQEKGLPQNSVVNMVADNYGFLWLATENGIARFDGVTFKTFNTEKPQPGLSSRMLGFVRKSDTVIWAFDNKYNAYVITRGRITAIKRASPSLVSIPLFNQFREIERHAYLKNVSGLEKYNWSLAQGRFRGFFLEKDTFAVCHNDGIGFYTSKGLDHIFTIKNFDNGQTARIGNDIIYIDNNKKEFLIIHADGQYGKKKLPFQSHSNWNSIENIDNINSCFISNGSYLFEVTFHHSNVVYTPLMDNFTEDNTSRYIFKKGDNMIICSSLLHGLYVYKKPEFKVARFPDYTGLKTFENNNSFYSQLLLPDNQTIVTGIDKKFDSSGFTGILKGGYFFNSRWSMKDSKKNYWYYDAKKAGATTFSLFKGGFNNTPATEMTCPLDLSNPGAIFEDSAGNIWISSNQGIGYFPPGAASFVSIHNVKISIEPVEWGNTYCMADDGRKIFIATQNGIYYYQENKQGAGIKKLALAGFDTRFIALDQQTKNLWVGTYGQGFYLLDNNGRLICKFPLDKEGNLRSVHAIIEDEQHRFWLPTNNGLFLTTRQSLENYAKNHLEQPFYYRFSTQNGFATNEFNGGCMPTHLRLPGGEISLPSMDGLVRFKPEAIKMAFSKDSILLENVFVNDKAITTLANNSFQVKESTSKSIVLELASSHISDGYDAFLEYHVEMGNQSGNKNWLPLGADNKLSFAFPKSGEYAITFRKRWGLDNSNFTYLHVNFVINPPWYKTALAISIALTLLFLLIWLYFYLNHKRVLHRNRLLQHKITVATEQLIVQNKDLQETNGIKNKLIALFNHDISIPMFYMEKTLQRVMLDKELNDKSRSSIRLVTNTTSELQALTNSLLVWIQLQQNKKEVVLEPEEVNILEIINTNLNIFNFRITEKKIRTQVNMSENLTVLIDRKLFSVVIYNLVANAVQHLKTGTIIISGNRSESTHLLQLEIESILDEEHHSTPTEIRPTTTKLKDELSRGMGLQIVDEFAVLLRLHVDYQFNSGSSKVSITGMHDE